MKHNIFIRNNYHKKIIKAITVLIRIILFGLIGIVVYCILSSNAGFRPVETKAATTSTEYFLQSQFNATWDITAEPTTEAATEPTTLIFTTITETTTQAPQPQTINLGEFRISHYCPCVACNGGYTNTALGTTITPYHTVAVDPNVIPLGSQIIIDGNTYVAEDTGSAISGKKIDFCVASHSEAYNKGIRYTNVYLVK